MAGLRAVKRSFSDPKVRKSVLRILRENVLCSMATVASGDRAHINTAYFCYSPAMEVYFLSDARSLHCRNLERNPSMAITIFRSTQVWGRPDRGLQFFGTCHAAKGVNRASAERLYGRRFPGYFRYTMGVRAEDRRTGDQLRSYRFYRFVPREVKILDERVFGGGVFIVASLTGRKGSR